jgi:hypothetical protein
MAVCVRECECVGNDNGQLTTCSAQDRSQRRMEQLYYVGSAIIVATCNVELSEKEITILFVSMYQN